MYEESKGSVVEKMTKKCQEYIVELCFICFRTSILIWHISAVPKEDF